jgi:hypothetical protein
VNPRCLKIKTIRDEGLPGFARQTLPPNPASCDQFRILDNEPLGRVAESLKASDPKMKSTFFQNSSLVIRPGFIGDYNFPLHQPLAEIW